MRKVSMMIAAIAMALPASVTISTPAQAGYNNIPDFCKNYVATGEDPQLNRGECISLLTGQFHYFNDDKNGNSYAVHACDYYAENYPDLFDALWSSKADCVDNILS